MRVARATSGLLRWSVSPARNGSAAWRLPSLGLSSAAEKASESKEPETVSWFQKIKGIFKGKQEQGQQPQQEHGGPQAAQGVTPDAELGERFTMTDFADQLKNARRFGSLTKFGRGLPRDGEKMVEDSLQKQEKILRALSRLEDQRIGAQQKAEVAAECSCDVKNIDEVIGKYEWMKEVHRRCKKLKEEGKPLPKDMKEVEAMMKGWWSPSASVNLGRSSDLSRNALCPCGSKKKYKRCCGKSLLDSL